MTRTDLRTCTPEFGEKAVKLALECRAHAYRKLLDRFGMQASMSHKGNCFDDAPVESFWGSLKKALTHRQRCETRAHARTAVQECIEILYNRQRRHSRLGHLSPAVFAETFKHLQAA